VADEHPSVGAAPAPSETPDAETWIDLLAGHLGEGTLTPKELGQVLKLARDVAHGVERKLAPPAAYLAGIHVGRRLADGLPREAALAEAVQVAAGLLPSQDTPDEAGGMGSSSSEG
jgi:Domain of unknown function (DUF6457)